MKRAVVVTLSVAILGVLSVYARHHPPASAVGTAKTSLSTNTAANTPATTNSTNPGSGTHQTASGYKNGTFKGNTAQTPYGPVQVAAVISNGKITDIQYLQMPSDFSYSQQVTAYVEPIFKQDTLQKQSSNVDFVSGATSTSYGYQNSLQSALDQAVGSSMMNSTTPNQMSGSNTNTNPNQGALYAPNGEYNGNDN